MAEVEGTELGHEYVTGSAIEWTAEESAAWVGESNDILVGDDLSLLIGSEENNWLIHRSAAEVFGEDGNSAWPERPFHMNDNDDAQNAREVA